MNVEALGIWTDTQKIIYLEKDNKRLRYDLEAIKYEMKSATENNEHLQSLQGQIDETMKEYVI